MRSENDLLPPRYLRPTRIGQGGMGEIFRAEDEVLGRTVAIKVLSEQYALDESLRARFTREALAAARLSGEPGAVTIFDVGEWAGRPFIVMEHLAGGSLEARLHEDGPPPVDEALGWLDQAAGALDAAHRLGVVHRDVKPGNLLLDEAGDLRVADFGIASAAGLHSLTLTGTVLGTAGYLSPEQARGERATPASDRYSLAVVAYELLTGRRPFESESPTVEAAAHVQAEVPSISPQLDPVFRRALAKDGSGAVRDGIRLRGGTARGAPGRCRCRPACCPRPTGGRAGRSSRPSSPQLCSQVWGSQLSSQAAAIGSKRPRRRAPRRRPRRLQRNRRLRPRPAAASSSSAAGSERHSPDRPGNRAPARGQCRGRRAVRPAGRRRARRHGPQV